MNKKVLSVLEFNKIINTISGFVSSDIGKEYVLALRTESDFNAVDNLLCETDAAESIMRQIGRSPVDYFPDIRDLLKNVSAVYALSTTDILKAAKCFRASRETRIILLKHPQDTLSVYTSRLISCEYIENEISRCIISEDEIADSASVELSHVRREIKITEERVKDKIGQYLKGSLAKYLQEPLYTVRNGRYVIPVKAEYKSYVPGLVHDQSSTGQTLYIEPASVVELGNHQRQLYLDERREIEKILARLTSLIAAESSALYNAVLCLGELDALFAKVKWCIDNYCIRPKINNHGYIRLIKARHPLLNSNEVVPISLWMGDTFRTLIITGPNTGGKTVSLKTVGLFCLLTQAGFFVPADEGTELSVFSEIYADIGDEQSIEQSLSTFSSHMKNIVSILDYANSDSLVLLDELGAGTDPLEGAALAQAILEYLKNAGAITFATTHYSEVKAYALATEGIENASMEFDVERLVPTYKIFIGIPGKSNAFEISKRLGLRSSIVERASDFLSSNEISFEDVLSRAQESKKQADRDKLEIEIRLNEVKKLQASLEIKESKLSSEAAAIRSKAREQAKEIVSDAKSTVDSLISELRRDKMLDTKTVEQAAMSAKDKIRELSEKFYDAPDHGDDLNATPITVVVGAQYYASKLQRNVTVLQKPDAKGNVLIQSGSVKSKLRLSDLSTINPTESLFSKQIHSGAKLNTQAVKMDLDLRGYTVDDAWIEIDRQIDVCHLHGLHEFNIIHGKGTGALRAGIHQYLKKDKRISTFRIGNYGEGDAGVTIVTLK